MILQIYAKAGTPEGKGPIQRQPLLVQYKQQANPLLSMHSYTPLVISGNDKNDQLTLLSHLPKEICFGSVNSEGHVKN
jgi:hypothetical protein